MWPMGRQATNRRPVSSVQPVTMLRLGITIISPAPFGTTLSPHLLFPSSLIYCLFKPPIQAPHKSLYAAFTCKQPLPHKIAPSVSLSQTDHNHPLLPPSVPPFPFPSIPLQPSCPASSPTTHAIQRDRHFPSPRLIKLHQSQSLPQTREPHLRKPSSIIPLCHPPPSAIWCFGSPPPPPKFYFFGKNFKHYLLSLPSSSIRRPLHHFPFLSFPLTFYLLSNQTT